MSQLNESPDLNIQFTLYVLIEISTHFATSFQRKSQCHQKIWTRIAWLRLNWLPLPNLHWFVCSLFHSIVAIQHQNVISVTAIRFAACQTTPNSFNTNGWHVANYILKCTFLNDLMCWNVTVQLWYQKSLGMLWMLTLNFHSTRRQWCRPICVSVIRHPVRFVLEYFHIVCIGGSWLGSGLNISIDIPSELIFNT